MSQRKKADILIVSLSGRGLAASAARGERVIGVIDAFSDIDTREHSAFYEQVPQASDGGFDAVCLKQTFERCIARNDLLEGWVAGSGLESSVNLLREMSLRLPLIGNEPRVFETCAHRDKLIQRAEKIGISCMPRHTDLPHLIKRPATCGGWHIHFDGMSEFSGIREAYLPGVSISHVFLASNEQILSVGFGTQWHSHHDKSSPFSYGGAINRCLLSESERLRLQEWSRRLSVDMGLRGLNNIDYLWCAGETYFLELNPRPSASMDIYDQDYPDGLFDAHIKSYRGQLPPTPPALKIRAHAVVYAQCNFSLPDSFQWGEVVSDIPRQHSFIKGQPVCSLIVQCATVESTLSSLQKHMHNLFTRFEREAKKFQSNSFRESHGKAAYGN